MAKKIVHAFDGDVLQGLQEEYDAARGREHIGVGTSHLFYTKLSRVQALPLSCIRWAYIRQEDSNFTVCCGRGTLPSYFLMAVDEQKRCLKMPTEREETVQFALKLLGEVPHIATGYSEEHLQASGPCTEQ